jgi:hypothetical protein
MHSAARCKADEWAYVSFVAVGSASPRSDGVSDGLDQCDRCGRVWWLAVGDGVDLTGKAPYFGDVDVGVAVGLQHKSGQSRDAFAGSEGLHDEHIVAEIPDARGESSFLLTQDEELLPAPFATHDPREVAMPGDAVVGSLTHEVIGSSTMGQAKSFFLDGVAGVAVDECDIDLAVSQRP